MIADLTSMVVTVLCSAGVTAWIFIEIRRHENAEQYKRGYDTGWVDRGIADWRKDQAKRDRLGRYKEITPRT
jgi:hypothetical protein